MPEETQWIDWHPKVGDVRPEVYRWSNPGMNKWHTGKSGGSVIMQWDVDVGLNFQIPAPVVTPPADRPPWIDPQCKFRWGDRVKYFEKAMYVINPNDADIGRVIAAPSLWEVPPYSTKEGLVDSGLWDTTHVDEYTECTLTSYPEDLPQHFDDRLLDADGPQEVTAFGSLACREIWVNEYSDGLGYGIWNDPEQAKLMNNEHDYIRTIHFREVL